MGEKPIIGFIGQGFVGKAYADDVEARGFEVVRYTRSEPYSKNKERIGDCDFVLIAVPILTNLIPYEIGNAKGFPLD